MKSQEDFHFQKPLKGSANKVTEAPESDELQDEEGTMSYYGFPLPEGWNEENRGIDENGVPHIELTNEFGMKVTQSEIRRRQKSHRSPLSQGKSQLNQVVSRFKVLCKKNIGTEPVTGIKALTIVKFALNTGGLSEKQIFDLFDEWFTLPDKKDEQLLQITQALSAKNITDYKHRNNVK